MQALGSDSSYARGDQEELPRSRGLENGRPKKTFGVVRGYMKAPTGTKPRTIEVDVACYDFHTRVRLPSSPIIT